jgi:DNA uptake protein ComE-like DNA-binding protein
MAMWKEWFYFTKGQRGGIIVLLLIILCLIIDDMTLPYLLPSSKQSFDLFDQQAKGFLDSLQTIPTKHSAPNSSYQTTWNKYPDAFNKQPLPKSFLFRFNPNELDSAGFVKLGLKPYMASNILKYRAKGGKFRKPEDFAKVWGITPDKFKELLPFIDIPAEAAVVTTNPMIPKIVKKDVVLELNSTDTTQLQQIRGIGRGYAKRIVAYRKRLGGFCNVSQLLEVWGMTPELYAQIAPHFTINTQEITKIPVNRASVERLMSHPYLNFTKAKAIYDLRRNKGKLTTINQLKTLDEFDPSTLAKIAPYISFQ